MRRAAHLPYVPTLIETTNGKTVVSESGDIWDAVRWMPGMPRECPTRMEIKIVCAAIAQLHVAWWGERTRAICRGVINRLRLLREWLAEPPTIPAANYFWPELNSLIQRASKLLFRLAPNAVRDLEIWENQPLFVQPCVRDLRLEHLLFQASQLTGIVDYGAMGLDHPAVDLARYIGECGVDPWETCRLGLNIYRSVANDDFDATDEFVMQLARSGALGSAIIWLRRWLSGAIPAVESPRVKHRLGLLIRAIELLSPN
jgi:homoserine kinase type II